MFPLDRNRLTREWFHSGRAKFTVAGVGPTGLTDGQGNPGIQVITPNLFPGVWISADLGNGPGIQEVATFSVDVYGAARRRRGLQRSRHGDRCCRWRAAPSVRSAHRLDR